MGNYEPTYIVAQSRSKTQNKKGASLDWVCLFPIKFKDNITISMVWNTGETGDI